MIKQLNVHTNIDEISIKALETYVGVLITSISTSISIFCIRHYFKKLISHATYDDDY